MTTKRSLTDIDIEQIILMAWGEKAWEAFARPCQIFLEDTNRNINKVYSGGTPTRSVAYEYEYG